MAMRQPEELRVKDRRRFPPQSVKGSIRRTLFVQNEPNYCRFWARNEDRPEKRTQTNPIRSQFQTGGVRPPAERAIMRNKANFACFRRKMRVWTKSKAKQSQFPGPAPGRGATAAERMD